jgi:transposase
MARTPSPSEVRHDEWALVAPSWTLLTAEAPQRPPRLRQVFTGWRWMARAGAPWRLLPNDLPPWAAVDQQPQRGLTAGVFEPSVHDWRGLLRRADGRTAPPSATLWDRRTRHSRPASGHRAGSEGTQRRRGSPGPLAGETLGPWWAWQVTPAPEQARAPVAPVADQRPAVTGDAVAVAVVDPGDTGDQPAQEAAAPGLHRDGVQRPEATNGFGRLPRRWVVARRVAWAARVRRRARDDARRPETLAGLHLLVVAILMLTRVVALRGQSA